MSQRSLLFEVSWEVCNKIGGIYSVITTKAPVVGEKYKNHHFMVGPDLLKEKANEEFIEDFDLYNDWRQFALANDLKVRIGRWNIPSQPVVILVDFTPFFSQKNEIFTRFWEKFRLDSLAGQWDYIEPAMFGYAAAKVIDSFYHYNFSDHRQAVAQFHEWMTGAGVLYLADKSPDIATVFTTHATVLGRILAGNHLPLYDKLTDYKPHIIARQFNNSAKYSLEKAAADHADVFTTVSKITASECEVLLQKAPDMVTPNGFDNHFVPQAKERTQLRKTARQRLKDVAEATLGYELKNPYFIINSGRYEFRNKGIDVFIDSLHQLEAEAAPLKDREVVAFIAVPAHHKEFNAEIFQRLNNHQKGGKAYINTHHLHDEVNDPVLTKMAELHMANLQDSKVKVIFAPVYFDGKDGLFNTNYYDLLVGFDLSVFPSYYEPWGYTPMESIAFGIPTITTDLAGYGQWIQEKISKENPGAAIVHRTDENREQSVTQIKDQLLYFLQQSQSQWEASSKDALKLAESTTWVEFAPIYRKAYKLALQQIDNRLTAIEEQLYHQKGVSINQAQSKGPNWKKALVKPNLPEVLRPLTELSMNIWWTWNYDAATLFKSINPILWSQIEYNPIALIEALDYDQIAELEQNQTFVQNLQKVYLDFRNYMEQKSKQSSDQIAYFSMEYGLHDTIKIFSGGLGMLAGDFIKEASDNNVNMVAVGLLYRYGYFSQKITQFGDQLATFSPQQFTHLPIVPIRDERGAWITIGISLPGRVLRAKVWKLNVGRVELYLLDTDIDENNSADRRITYQLYGGDHNNRFLQELLLGVGGIRLLDAIKHNPTLYHCNEGHAAFIGVERLRKYIGAEHLNFEVAKEVVRASTLFTTHTPVPAGHDRFDEDLLRAYLPHYAERLNIRWDQFMALGRENTEDLHEKFSMSVLAMKLSQGMNGVSKIHGRVSREMFASMFPGYYPNELYISYVTNGVHLPTWASKGWGKLYQRIEPKFFAQQDKMDLWNKIYEVDNAEIFELRNNQRSKLMAYLRPRLEAELRERNESPKLMVEILKNLKDDVLTIGFARRFATYKRAHLLFNDLEKLDQIINNPKQPIQFLFAGKAHPADKAGQDLIKRIYEISKMPQFVGKIIFVENYDIALGKRLTSGVDVWLNTPTRPLEASGTSGEKAVMNGVLNFSVLDGWWAEGYKEGAGWALKEERTYDDQGQQDALDANLLYYIFEEEIAPKFYKRSADGIPVEWMEMIKKNIAEISPRFTMKRMLDDYTRQYYAPQMERTHWITKNHYEQAHQLTQWKNTFAEQWKKFELVKIEYPDSNNMALSMGDEFKAKVWMRIGECNPEFVGVELVTGYKENQEIQKILDIKPLTFVKINEGVALFEINLPINRAGVFDFAFRVFPKNSNLPHRQDFPLIEWI